MPKLSPNGVVAHVRKYADSAPPPGTLIRCGKCESSLPPDEFYIAAHLRALAQGRRCTSNWCRSCTSGYMKNQLSARRDIVDQAKAGGCTDCGIVDLEHPEIFDFDHILPGKARTVTAWITAGTVEDLLAEMDRCEVVCANCHRRRTKARGSNQAMSDLRKS